MAYRALLLLILTIACPLSATAQINPFRGSRGTPLNAEDLSALRGATNRLLESPQLAIGSQESWSNAKTGIAGTVTAGDPVQLKGLSCRVTDYTIIGPRSAPARDAKLTWCKTKEGWKIGQ